MRSYLILSTPATLVAKFNNQLSSIRSEHKVNDKVSVIYCLCVQLSLISLKTSHCIKDIENTREHANCLVSLAEYSGVCYNERCCYKRMLQRTVFINKVRMLLRTRRNTIGRRSTRVRMTCHAFPLWLVSVIIFCCGLKGSVFSLVQLMTPVLQPPCDYFMILVRESLKSSRCVKNLNIKR